MVESLPSDAGGMSSIPGQGRSQVSRDLQPKNQSINRSNIVTKSINTFKKMAHIKKSLQNCLKNKTTCNRMASYNFVAKCIMKIIQIDIFFHCNVSRPCR